MKIPFIYGKVATGNDAINRLKEVKKITSNLASGKNMVLISPRKWGKSSLLEDSIKKALAKNKKMKIVSIDLFNVKSEEEFLKKFVEEIIREVATKKEDISAFLRTYLSHYIPRISYGSDTIKSLSMELDWLAAVNNPEEILSLGDKIAKEKKVKLVICLDSFQSVLSFPLSEVFQKTLSNQFRKHKNTSYMLVSGNRQLMFEAVTTASKSFYKFGEVVELEKIGQSEWVNFLTNRYKQTNKQLDKVSAKLVTTLVESHPFYVQQLAQQCWLRTPKKCTRKIIEETFDALLCQTSLSFQLLTEELTNSQTGFLKALVEETEQLSSKETIVKYHLGTSANVARIKQALIQRELIDVKENSVSFTDPLYKAWLKRHYFVKG